MKKVTFLWVISLWFLLPGTLFAQVSVREEWVARYNGTGNTYDWATAIAVDTSGNVYVTGASIGDWTTGFDYATIKYDTNGNELWVKRYNGPLGNWFSHDYATDIAVDSFGNVYVTGYSFGVQTGIDYATIKYDTNGNEQWVARYNGIGNVSDVPSAIILDSFGNLYVTGKSYIPGSVSIYNYVTVKYDTNGNQLWVASYRGPESSIEDDHGIGVDAAGNVYITGVWNSYAESTSWDYLTIKYDTNGNELWVRRYNGPTNSHDYGTSIAVDSAGNAYVTGSSGISGPHYATVKYDTNGTEQWVATYGLLGGGQPRAIGVDSVGNIYVTGKASKTVPLSGWGYTTVKYSPKGTELWVTTFNGQLGRDDLVKAMAVDPSGNVCITGWSRLSYYDSDYLTVKYNSDGEEIWSSRYDAGGLYGDFAEAIAMDSSGNVYVTGYSYNADTEYDYVTVKYTESPPVNPPVDTPVGSNVTVDLGSGVTATFSDVSVAGTTTVTVTNSGPPPLTGFKLAGNYYEISTTAVYTGPVIIEIVYDDTGMTTGQEKTLKLFHLESGVWVNVTTSLDTVNNIITGQVTNLSLFAIMFELGPPGWDEGEKTGWEDENSSPGLMRNERSPEGFDKGRKSGWWRR